MHSICFCRVPFTHLISDYHVDYHVDNHAWNFLVLIALFALKLSRKVKACSLAENRLAWPGQLGQGETIRACASTVVIAKLALD